MMDAKLKANFIHSVSGGQKISCPVCNCFNESGALFCSFCGAKLGAQDNVQSDSESDSAIVCPACNEPNEVGSSFCVSCGAKLIVKENQSEQAFEPADRQTAEKEEAVSSTPAFSPVETHEAADERTLEEERKRAVTVPIKQAFQTVTAEEAVETEEISVFAKGLPSWDIVPPHVMVRRKKNK